MNKNVRHLPQLGKLLEAKEFKGLNTKSLKKIAKELLEELRQSSSETPTDEARIIGTVLARYKELSAPSFIPLINATGVVIHTNLGRSPISPSALEYATKCATSYCNLEYDMGAGKRGDRYGHLTRLARFLFGCEDILLVNNNAAAVFLILNTFAKNKECVVSRGELVEIGGGFRIPEVMASSGAKLCEIGTTNKTRIDDYQNAINEKTKIVMKVHRSNFVINGFTQEADFSQIVELARKSGLIDYYDLGSASLLEAKEAWANGEPNIFELMALNPSLISFSGDKVFGSIQAGIILGKKELIDKLKKNQLLRMLRCDKITLALVEQTMLEYAFGDASRIPTADMLTSDAQTLRKKASELLSALNDQDKFELANTCSYVGGGSLPQEKIDSIALSLKSHIKPEKLIKTLREQGVIARIENERVLLDVRTLTSGDVERLATILNGLSL